MDTSNTKPVSGDYIMTTKQFKIIAPITKTSDGDDGAVYIEGIANTGQEDLAGDIITRDALTQIVNQLPNRNLHLDHVKDFDGILGPIVASELRDEGAWFKARLVDERKDIIQSYLEQGVHFGTSISGDCNYEEGSMSNIISWDLVELSLTDIPCDQGTMGTVSLSKSFDGILQSIKQKQLILQEEEMEEESMAEEEVTYTTEEAVIELINTAFNERKDEFLEQIRDEVKTEYESVIGELTSRVEALENAEKPAEEEEEPVPAEEQKADEEEEEETKATDEEEDEDEDKHIEELVNKRLEEIFGGLNKEVDFKYSSQKKTDKSQEKSFSPHEIASL